MDVVADDLIGVLEMDIPTPYRIFIARHKTVDNNNPKYFGAEDKQDAYRKLSKIYPHVLIMAWKITEIQVVEDNSEGDDGLNRRPRHLSTDPNRRGGAFPNE